MDSVAAVTVATVADDERNANGAIDVRRKAESTKNVITSAIKAYDGFAAHHKPPLPSFEQTTADVFCEKRHVQEFAHYLVYEMVGKQSNEPLSDNTVKDYMSGVMNAAKERFEGTHRDFFLVLGGHRSSIATVHNWYQQTNFNISDLIRKRDINAGLEIEEDTPGLSRAALVQVVGAYYACDTNDAFFRRFVLLLIWHGVGRVAECTMLNWDLVKWCHTSGLLYFKWSQTKTSKQKRVIVCGAADGYAADFYHALGCFLMAGFGQSTNAAMDSAQPCWLLPELKAISPSGVSKHVAQYLTDCKASKSTGTYAAIQIDGMDDDVSGNSMRHGAINACKTAGVPFEVLALSSGHEMTGKSAMFNYVYYDHVDTAPAAEALAGHGLSKCPPTLPTFASAVVNNNLGEQHEVDEFLKNLLQLRRDVFYKDGRLRKLVEACGARLVQFFRATLNAFGENHLVNRAILAAGDRVRSEDYGKLSRVRLLQWSDALDADCARRNPAVVDNTAEGVQQLTALATQLLAGQQQIIGKLEKKCNDLQRDLSATQAVVATFEGMLLQVCQSTTLIAQSPRKRTPSKHLSDFIYDDSSATKKRRVTASSSGDGSATSSVMAGSFSLAAGSTGSTSLEYRRDTMITGNAGLDMSKAVVMKVIAGKATWDLMWDGKTKEGGRDKAGLSDLKKVMASYETFITETERQYLNTLDKKAENYHEMLDAVWEIASCRYKHALMALEKQYKLLTKKGKLKNGKMQVGGVHERIFCLPEGVSPKLTENILKINGYGDMAAVNRRTDKKALPSKPRALQTIQVNSFFHPINSSSSSSSGGL